MDPVSIAYMLISSGLLTQLVKWGLGFIKTSPDSKYTPMIAAIVGAVNDALVVSPDGTVTNAGENPAALLQSLFEGGAIGGLGAVGAHQMLFSKNYIKKPDVASGTNSVGALNILFPYLLPLLFVLSLSGCSAVEGFLKSDEAKQFDFRVTSDDGCKSLVILSSALGEKKAEIDTLGKEGARSYLALQTFIQVMGSNCKS